MVLRANNALPRHRRPPRHVRELRPACTRWASTTSSGARTQGPGDQVFYQGHAAPGIYARAFLEGRLSEDQLDHFRREVVPGARPQLLPAPAADARLLGVPDGHHGPRADPRDLPGPLQPLPGEPRHRRHVRLARLGLPGRRRDGRAGVARRPLARRPRGARQPDLRRQLQPAAPRRPGPRQRQDHPGARGALPRRRLERHQGDLGPRVGRPPGPRRGRRPRQPDERDASTASSRSTPSPAAPTSASTSSGRTRASASSSSTCPTTTSTRLRRGGHDYRKVYAAYKAATEHQGAPTVILAKTVKGWTLGPGVEGRNITHQAKKLSEAELRVFRDRLELPIPDEKLKDAPVLPPGPRVRGGPVPPGAPPRARRPAAAARRPGPARCRPRAAEVDAEFAKRLGGRRQHDDGLRQAPAQPDPRPGARAAHRADHPRRGAHLRHGPALQGGRDLRRGGQRYEPVDSDLVLSYREAKDGQVLEEGITEAGSMASLPGGGDVVRDATASR